MKIYYKLLFTFASIFIASCNSSNKNKDAAANETADSIAKPNIIYILADDLGYGDLSVYGQEKFETPHIDKLAERGMLFTQHYSGSTVCAPSRSALMTGMHTGHTVVRGNKEVQPEGQHPIPDSTYTLAEAMKKAGYVTGAFGKWGLGFPGSEGDPTNQGFDTFYGYNCQRLGHNYYPDHLWSNTDSIVLSENTNKKDGAYAPELIHRETLKFIDTHKHTPFFLYVPTIIPHAELAAPEEYMEKHRGKYPPEKAYEGVDDGPNFNQGPYRSQEETHAAFAAMIDVLDDQVGDIMAKVDDLGLADNTIIIFTSDNGPHEEGGADPEYFDSNGPFKGVKRDLYEGGIRVPMIASWPGRIAPGSKTDLISAFWDILPTFSDIVGISVPDDTDGISLLPTLLGNDAEQKHHDYLYWEFHERGGRQAVRKGKWKAVRYNVFKNPNGALELYDLDEDRGETNNVAEEHPDVVAEMEDIIETARTPSDIFTFGQGTYLADDD
ncbi:arylsulfatase [Pricia sp. S334]|uniref:Arylsulfatase n=1 Tax=Pricia mediterranea TaxID=3076079 RepID=A0ABU3L7N7_9FLAO|nr:arylsulfatase [Pricia sp. S334]MDT7829336.1 arylsulfatase [Pricia sp. S334]